ncbi:MAG: BT4734/BF3469 family protein [Thermodesulfobacteriota bacterium]
MDSKNLLDKRVSFQTSAWTPLSKEMTIQEVIDEIKSEKYFSQIDRLRSFIQKGETDQYNIHKKNLPAVTFCGTFDGKRKKEHLKEYNQIIVLDIDKVNANEFERVKTTLEKDNYVFASWVSPSQKGIKGLVGLLYNLDINNQFIDDYHKGAFIQFQKYFSEKYNIELDVSGSDTTRLCFLSHDPNLSLKSDFVPFVIDEIELVKPTVKNQIESTKKVKSVDNLDSLFNPQNKNNPNNRKTIQAIIKFLTKRNLSITYSYEEWYRVAYAISNTFTYDIGEKYFLSLSKIDGNKFNETNCKNMLIYCYKNKTGEINLNTIIYFANKKGYYTKNQRGVGVPKAAKEN